MLRKLFVMPVIYGLLVFFAACAQPGGGQVATEAPATPTELGQASTSAPTETTAPPTETVVAATGTPSLELLDTQTTTTTSPDGAWVAVSEARFPVTKAGAACEGCGEQYWARLTVSRADGSQAWEPVAEWRPMGLGYGVPAAFQWSADGTALYFTEIIRADGCGFVFSNGSGLKRLDLASGAVAELVPATGYWLTLAPDEQQAAYMAYGQRGLVVRALATGTEQAYALDDLGAVQMGAVVWAPNASAVALTVENAPCGGEATRAVIEVKLADGARRVLLPPTDRPLTTVAWPEAGRLRLVDEAGAFWVLEAATGQLTPEG